MDDQMNNQDEMKIIKALADFQPTPSARLQQRMDAAPWMQIESAAPTFTERHPRRLPATGAEHGPGAGAGGRGGGGHAAAAGLCAGAVGIDCARAR